MNEAVTLAEQIVNGAASTACGAPTWLTVSERPSRGLYQPTPLPPEGLLSQGVLAIFLASFVGLHYAVLYDVSEVGVLRADVLSGVGGLAIVLADLFAATGEKRFHDAAARLSGTVHASLTTTLDKLAG